MENKKFRFGYEDTDQRVEINLYGLDFEINNLEDINKLEKLDKGNGNEVEAQLEEILGKGAIDKINSKRIKDGYKELDLNIELSILGCIFEVYAKSVTGNVLNRVTDTINDISKDVNGMNREQRRGQYKNFYNRNKGYVENRRNYRRY